MYSIENKAEVFGFIRQHSFLWPLLKEAYPRIQESFPKANIQLKLVEDPEIEELTHIAAFVLAEDEPDEFLAKFSRIQREWLAELIKKSNRKFALDVELI